MSRAERATKKNWYRGGEIASLGGRPRRPRRRPPWLGGAGRKIQIWGPETRFLTKKFDLGWLPSAHEMGKKHRTRTAVGCFDVALTHVDCRVRTQNKNSSKCHLVFLTFANATAFVAKLCPTFASYAASKSICCGQSETVTETLSVASNRLTL